MTESPLGKLINVYGVSAVFKQRAFVVAIVSFVFFAAMVVGFLVRPGFVFVLLATAFSVVCLFTILGWLVQRKTEFKLFENGFVYKKFVCLWTEIEAATVKIENSRIGGAKKICLVRKTDGQEILLTDALAGFETIVQIINSKKLSKNSAATENQF